MWGCCPCGGGSSCCGEISGWSRVPTAAPGSTSSSRCRALAMPHSGGQLRLVLADDHTMVREGLNEVLSLEADLKVVGEAGTGVEAIALVKQLRPDVVILDVEMPQHDVTITLRQIRQASPRTKVIVLTMHD